MVIGVTGRIATGKTSVADIFEANGFFRIDADKVYHALRETSAEMNNEIFLRFKSLENTEILNRIKNEKNAIKDLNNITHKYVVKKIEELINNNIKNSIILDVPVPVENGFLNAVDYVIVTNCSTSTQISRVINRDGEDENGANIKVSMQNDSNYYINLGDMIIETDDLSLKDLSKIIKKEFNL